MTAPVLLIRFSSREYYTPYWKKYNIMILVSPSLQSVKEAHTCPTQDDPLYSNTETLPRPPPTAFTLDPISSGLPSDTMK